MLETLFSDAESFVRANGPLAVGAVIFFESLGAPLPGESLLVVSSALAARGEMSLAGLMIWAWAGAVLGDSAGYLIGRSAGRGLIVRYGQKFGLTHERFQRVEDVFARYGPIAVSFARFFNILRQLNGLAAGTVGMPFPRFILFNAIGGLLWVGTWCLGTWYFSDHVSSIRDVYHHLGPAGIAVACVGAILVVGAVLLLARVIAPPQSRD